MAEALTPHSAVLDGEVVAFNEKGQTSFQRLQHRMHVIQPAARLLADTPVAFVAFDVLWLDGELLVDRPQTERRRVLDGLGLKGRAWQTAPVLDASPDELLEACRQAGLEGFLYYPSSRGGHRPRGQRVGRWTIRALKVGTPYHRRRSRSEAAEQKEGAPPRAVDGARRTAMLRNVSRNLFVGPLTDCFFDPDIALCLRDQDRSKATAPIVGRRQLGRRSAATGR